MVSRLSGHLFERRLIEKYLATEHKCPVTGEEMGLGDLIAVKGACLFALGAALSLTAWVV